MITTSDTNDVGQDDNGNLINFLFGITLKNVYGISLQPFQCNQYVYILDTDELLPNLECEVEINEDPDDEPQPISVKSVRINDIKANSGEGAKNPLESQDKTNSSPISSPITEKEKDKLACDLAEFETDVIGEQLDRKTSDI